MTVSHFMYRIFLQGSLHSSIVCVCVCALNSFPPATSVTSVYVRRLLKWASSMNLLRLKEVGGCGSLEDTLISHFTIILCESCTLNSGRHCLKVITLGSLLLLLSEDDPWEHGTAMVDPVGGSENSNHTFVGPCEKDAASNSVKLSNLDDCDLIFASTHTSQPIQNRFGWLLIDVLAHQISFVHQLIVVVSALNFHWIWWASTLWQA